MICQLLFYHNDEYTQKFDQVFCFYNDEELGMDDINAMMEFYGEEGPVGLPYEDLDTWTFLPKQYAWFRDVMDSGVVQEDDIVTLIQYMLKHKKSDLREFDEDEIYKVKLKDDSFWDEQFQDDYSFYIPDQTLQDIRNLPKRFTLCRGGGDECLKEIQYLLDALKYKYKTDTKYVYW